MMMSPARHQTAFLYPKFYYAKFSSSKNDSIAPSDHFNVSGRIAIRTDVK